MRDMIFIFSCKFIHGFGYYPDKYCGGFVHVDKVNCCGYLISLHYLQYERPRHNWTRSVRMAIYFNFFGIHRTNYTSQSLRVNHSFAN